MAAAEGHRLVLFPCPLQGHINPMLQLATLLHGRGFSITVIHTEFNSPNPSNHPDFHFEFISDGLSAKDLSAGSALGKLNVVCEGPLRDRLTEIMSKGGEDPIRCIISDSLMYFTHAVAEELGLPRLVLRASSLSSFISFEAYPLLRQKGYLPIQDPHCEDLVPELPPLRVMDLPHWGAGAPDWLFQFVNNFVETTKASSGLIANTMDALEEDALAKLKRDLPCPVFPVGPLHEYSSSSSSSLLTVDFSCIDWLDKQAPGSVIYVSFGSTVALEQGEFEETTWGLLNSQQPFLWVVRRNLVRGSERVELPEWFEEESRGRGRVVEWAPQQEVLAHPAVGGFWTHSGWNSTLETISHGVPALCSPSFGDQRVNARYLSHVWKVGLQLEKGLERSEIEKAVRKLLVGEEGKELRQRAESLSQIAKSSVKESGSSCEALNKLVDHILSL